MEQTPVAHRRHARLVGLILFVAVLFGLFVYGLTRPVKRYNPNVKQKAQFYSIEAALALFDSQFKGYPPSDANDATGLPYCGAMRLAEAIMGQDLMGYHPKSAFRADGLDPNTHAPLYTVDTTKARSGPFLPLENANVYSLADVYGKGKTGPFPENGVVQCDVFSRKLPNGRVKIAGMPLLYYRARPSGTKHDPDNLDDPQNIYDYRDNLALLRLGVPGDPNVVHPLADPKRFYLNTQNTQISGMSRPFRADSYILISAGLDGLYGTADDICNFTWQYRER